MTQGFKISPVINHVLESVLWFPNPSKFHFPYSFDVEEYRRLYISNPLQVQLGTVRKLSTAVTKCLRKSILKSKDLLLLEVSEALIYCQPAPLLYASMVKGHGGGKLLTL